MSEWYENEAKAECIDLRQRVAELTHELSDMREKARDLVCAMEPFAKLMNTTSGRIPVEQLSLANWHDLVKAYNKPLTAQEPDANRGEFYLQDSRSTVGNAVLWWCHDGNGYTTDLTKAAKFNTRERTMRPSDIPWPVSYIDSIAKPTVDFQKLDHGYHGEEGK